MNIDQYIEQVRAIADSEDNHRRITGDLRSIFWVEDPIGWVELFNFDANRYLSDPAFYLETVLRGKLWRWRQFPDDNLPMNTEVSAWLGWYPEYTCVGMDVEFTSAGVPIIQKDHPLSRTPDITLLQPVKFATSGWMPRAMKWHEDIANISKGRLNISFGAVWTRGCLDLAIQLRGYENFVNDTVERPGFVHDLLRFLVEQRCRWWNEYYRHFGIKPQPVGIADDWINVPFITPSMFCDFILPRYKEIEEFHGGLLNVHSCGNQAPIQKYLLELTSLPCIEVSPWTDLNITLQNIPPDKHLGISLHPNDVLFSTEMEMAEKFDRIRTLCEGRSFSVATSGLTPIEKDITKFEDKIRTWTRLARERLQAQK